MNGLGCDGDLGPWKRVGMFLAGRIKLCRTEMRQWEHWVGNSWGYLCTHLGVNNNTL